MILEVCIEDTGIQGERWSVVNVETGEELSRHRNQGDARKWCVEQKLNLIEE